jgi:hypothetical protein
LLALGDVQDAVVPSGVVPGQQVETNGLVTEAGGQVVEVVHAELIPGGVMLFT